LLLDSGELGGSFFQRTVLLICQHDAEGAFGLVLNRASGNKAGEMIVADLPDVLKEQPLFVGGPVQPSALSFLHSDAFLPEATVLPNLSMGHSLDSLVEIGESFSPTKKLKLFAGYAGWSPGQLESEMKRKAWLTHPASLELIFDTPPEKLWQTVLQSKGGWQNRLLAQSPEDLVVELTVPPNEPLSDGRLAAPRLVAQRHHRPDRIGFAPHVAQATMPSLAPREPQRW
jgi:putative transcriptional regulator